MNEQELYDELLALAGENLINIEHTQGTLMIQMLHLHNLELLTSMMHL